MNPEANPEASTVVTPHPVQQPASEFIIENIPQILRDTPLWGVWKYELRKDETKWSKVPYRSIYTHELNSSSDVSKWSTFDAAMDAWSKHPELSGLNFLIPKTSKDGIVGIDLDNCFINSETLKPWAQEIVNQFPNNYIEISPSGKGLKFIIKAEWRLKKHGKTHTFPAVLPGDENDGKLEMFGHQIFTITANRFRNSPIKISNGQEQLDHLLETYFTTEKQIDFSKYQPPVETGNSETDSNNWINSTKIAYDSIKVTTQWDCIDDIQVIEYLKNSIYDGEKFKQLMKGDTSCALHDASRADLTLCNMLARGCKGNPEQIDRIFRQSGLMRDKWLRADYRHSTIGKAVLSYSQNQARKMALQSEPDESNDTIESLNQPVNTIVDTPVNSSVPSYKMTDAGNPVDIKDYFKTMLPPKRVKAGTAIYKEFKDMRKVIIGGFLRQGETANISAPTKVGKSWIVLNCALSIVKGSSWLGLPCRKGRVLLLDNELHDETLRNRIKMVNDLPEYHIPLDELDNGLEYMSLRGYGYDINNIYSILRDIRPEEFDLIVMDAWYRFQSVGFDENSNGATKDAYNTLDQYTRILNTAFMAVHHTSKGNKAAAEIVDMGSGAGSQNRITDTVMGIKRHSEPKVMVFDFVTRSFPSTILPSCWKVDNGELIPMPHLNPNDLKKDNSRSKPEDDQYTNNQKVVDTFLNEKPKAIRDIIIEGDQLGLSEKKVRAMLRKAAIDGYCVETTKGKSLMYALKPDFEPIVKG